MAERKGQIYLGAMAALWLVFGVITIFYPRLMELFMTERGREADTAFPDSSGSTRASTSSRWHYSFSSSRG
jgi:hypothetical protein